MKRIAFAVAGMFIASAIFAQEIRRERGENYTYLDKSKELHIRVQIWGKVHSPGIYSVPNGTDLIALISLAGGPSDEANLSDVKIARSTESAKVLKVNVNKYLKTGNREDVPILQPGDTVVVSGNLYHFLSKIVRFLSQVAIVASTYNLFFGE